MKKYKSNNIIIILGNGFDRAHNLKTSYSDFADWFISKIEKKLTIFIKNPYQKNLFISQNVENYFKKENLDVLERNRIIISEERFIDSIVKDNHFQTDKLKDLLKSNQDKISSIISNEFMGKLYNNEYKNWFDIENAYFQELNRIKEYITGYLKIEDNKNRSDSLKNGQNKLKKLNRELVEIKNYLKEYLKTRKPNTTVEIDAFFDRNFDDYNFENSGKCNIYFINFNYTNTIDKYTNSFMSNNTNHPFSNNHIHGSLEKDNIIFGYGNDQHKDYQEIKDLEINEFLENFKTFEYLKTNNYSKIYDDALDNFDDYIVFVLGYSLGATDKTLLEEIFNNDKCKQIHLFKRRDLENDKEKLEKSFNDLVFSASRILTNEKGLRKKILNFNDSEFFP